MHAKKKWFYLPGKEKSALDDIVLNVKGLYYLGTDAMGIRSMLYLLKHLKPKNWWISQFSVCYPPPWMYTQYISELIYKYVTSFKN